MFTKKLIIAFSGIVLLIAAILIYSSYKKSGATANIKKTESKLVDVDNIVENPEKYTGIINVEGKVKELSDKKNFFSLGCEDDEDANIPVLYRGELPRLERNVVVTGEIKKDANGKFFFDAKDINYK